MNKFNVLNINPLILKGIERKQFEEMTEVQEMAIPTALENLDVIAQAPTGTGKTCAFAIPLLENVDENETNVQAIIMSPTRELAVQTTEEIREIAYYKENIRVITIYGGENIERQISGLRKKPQIVVATPGRLMDHMRRGTIKLNKVKFVVLDEADEMLNMGFREDIDTILAEIDSEHQTMLFSATISKDIEQLARKYLKDPTIIRVSKKELTVELITQKYINVLVKDKVEIISRIIDLNNYRLSMIFCNTKRAVDEVTSELLTRGFLVEALHGDMKQMQRDRVMSRFKEGQINILVASDVAARGLDVDDVDVVFNYDLPTDMEYYVHRIGRTGRAKKEGLAVSLVSRNEKRLLRSIVDYTKAVISMMDVPKIESVMKARIERMIEKAQASEQDSKAKKIVSKIVSELEEAGYDKDALIQGLILMNLKTVDTNNEVTEVKEEIERRKTRRENSEARIWINIGRKDKLKVYHLTDFVIAATSLTNDEINNVEILDSFSYFEVPLAKVDEILNVMPTKEYLGRKIVVQKANARTGRKHSDGEGGERRRYDSKPRDGKSGGERRRDYSKPRDGKSGGEGRRDYSKPRDGKPSSERRDYSKPRDGKPSGERRRYDSKPRTDQRKPDETTTYTREKVQKDYQELKTRKENLGQKKDTKNFSRKKK